MKYLITGLGNIGFDYINTRHNIGFEILDAFAKASNVVFTDRRYGAITEIKYKARTFILLKPNTYVNRSGLAINYWLDKEKIAVENLLVAVDDLALPFGTVRLRAKGSSAGHNGLTNIQQVLGHSNYPRLRFGIGDNFGRGQQIDYVLGEWTSEEKAKLPELIEHCVEAIKSFGTIGIQRAMNQFNIR